ncbi:MAG: N-acetyl-gamma-glutamyl-phosphate reductase [Gammaproteobacteria bacterium]|nr:N-acetyl-gamma-glutamyl-phosphate reductase [Gammaproteobacteria bacterium]
MIKVGIVGATGYTGVELLRLLATHPDVGIEVVTSRSESGKSVADLFPNLRGHLDIQYSKPDPVILSTCDAVFFATPNGTAMNIVPELLQSGVRVIDLAADFRLRDKSEWEKWYGMTHACPELLEEAVYGLSEVNRDAIKAARLVANPGCYPTAVQLGFMPLIKNDVIDLSNLIADTKSGVSGAGRKAVVDTLFCETQENFKAYGVDGHRHLPEIRQELTVVSGKAINLTFVPHLTPMIRGMHATLYAPLVKDNVNLQSMFEAYYKNAMFVDVMPEGAHPETRSVSGANVCRLAVHRPQNSNNVVVLSVIDNLMKGAAGQAVQNFNIMFGLDEAAGLVYVPVLP